MKNNHRIKIFTFVLLAAYLLAACAGAPATATNVGGSRPLAHPVTYLGVIESISGEHWTISGVSVTVTSDIVRDGPFAVGDQIKVEAVVNADGSLSISRVEAPDTDDLSNLPQLGNDNDASFNDDNSNDAGNSNANSNDANANDDNSNGLNSNDGNANDDNGINSNSNADDDDNGNVNSNDNEDEDDDDDDDDDNSND